MSKGHKKIEPEKDGVATRFKKGNKVAETWTEEIATQLGNDLIDWLNAVDDNKQDKGNIFFEEFLVIEKDLHPSTIAYLRGKYSPFSKLIEKAKKIQELKLVKYGVADRLNATMTKFVLTNHHNYSEKTDKNITGEMTVKQITGMEIK